MRTLMILTMFKGNMCTLSQQEILNPCETILSRVSTTYKQPHVTVSTYCPKWL